MAADFFEKELCKAQDRFNQNFGKLIACDIKTRQRAMLQIIRMSLLRNKINQENVKERIVQHRSNFVLTRNRLNSLFNQVENEIKERRDYANRHSTGEHQHGTGIVQRGSPGM